MSSISLRSVLIYGMGMMGASLALALRKRWPQLQITGVVRGKSSADWIIEHRLADSVHVASAGSATPAIDLDGYELIVLALPLGAVIELAAVFPDCKNRITDMSSARVAVDAAFVKRGQLRFIGSHPMCGSENRGPQAASAELYKHRLCLISDGQWPYPGGDAALSADRAWLREFWEALGMQVCTLPADLHDETLARLSHAPHILSGILTRWAAAAPAVQECLALSPMPITGGGFKDMARIAGSNPEMWRDILRANRSAVLRALQEYSEHLARAMEQLRSEPIDEAWWTEWFQEARRDRNQLCGFAADE